MWSLLLLLSLLVLLILLLRQALFVVIALALFCVSRFSFINWHWAAPMALMVVAVGAQWPHWTALLMECRRRKICIENCTIDVRDVFSKEFDEPTYGNGFDPQVRRRIKNKPTWQVVWTVAMSILDVFGLLVVVCNQGKHRSLSLAYEIAERTGCELVCIQPPRNWNNIPQNIKVVFLEHADEFVKHLDPRLTQHQTNFEHIKGSIVSIRVCNHSFDGPSWVTSHQHEFGPTEAIDPKELHILRDGDVIVQVKTGLG